MLAVLGFYQAICCNLNWVSGGDFIFRSHTRMRSKYSYTRPLAIDLKLFDRIWALQVGGDQHGSVAFLLQVLGKLPSQGRFTGTLETNQHDNCRRIFRKIDLASFA